MAMIKCKECNHEMSDKAKNCPNCGCVTERKKKARKKLILLIILVILISGGIFAFSKLYNKLTDQSKYLIGTWKLEENSEKIVPCPSCSLNGNDYVLEEKFTIYKEKLLKENTGIGRYYYSNKHKKLQFYSYPLCYELEDEVTLKQIPCYNGNMSMSGSSNWIEKQYSITYKKQ